MPNLETKSKTTRSEVLGENKNLRTNNLDSQEPKNNSIEAKITQLDESIEWFYGEDFNIDQAIDRYKQAAELSKSIQKDLEQLKNEVEVIADFTKA